MTFLGGRCITRSQRQGVVLILLAASAALSMAIASPAQAAPNVAYGWGLNSRGSLGDGSESGPETCEREEHDACSTKPLELRGLSGVTAVAANDGGSVQFNHSLALREGGTVMAWGGDSGGVLGGGSETDSDVPVAVCAPAPEPCPGSQLSGAAAIAAGGGDSVALLSNGTVVDWGYNYAGQLGNGTTTKSSVPVAVCAPAPEPCPGSQLSGVTAVAAGDHHVLALLSNGTVVAWGGNESGQLGDGATTPSDVPVAVSGLSGATAIAAGANHSLALLSNGTVRAWGSNAEGQLGNGTTTGSDVPVAVSGLTEVKSVSAGYSHSIALLKSGKVVAWGRNENGQLGDGSHTGPESCTEFMLPCAKSPVAVSGLGGVSAVSAGDENSAALLAGGGIMAWGENDAGQLGVGTSTGPEPCSPFADACSTTPVAVPIHGAIVGVAAGGADTFAFGPPPPSGPLPEIGRCVKVKKGTGEYKGSKCIGSAEGKGIYDWVSGPGAKKAFKFRVEAPILTSHGASKTQIRCPFAEGEGEYTGSKTVAVKKLVFANCQTPAAAGKSELERWCQNNGAFRGEISASELTGEVGFILSTTSVGLDLKPTSGSSLAAFECGGAGELTEHGMGTGTARELQGSVIGHVLYINAMRLEDSVKYVVSKTGAQVPEHFENGAEDTLTTLVGHPGTPEATTLSGVQELENEEPLEIRAKT